MLKIRNMILVVGLLTTLTVSSQEKHKVTSEDYSNDSVEMADQFRKDGKIYVVVTVALVILGGLVAYALRIDKKVSKLEREIQNKIG